MSSVQIVRSGSTVTIQATRRPVLLGQPIVTSHNALQNRDADDAHPTSAITGLDDALAGKQPVDAELTALAGLATAPDKLAYWTGTALAALCDFTVFGRTLVACATAGAALTALGAEPAGSAAAAVASHVAAPDPHSQYRLESDDIPWSEIASTPTTLAGYGITDAQPVDADLTAIAALTTTAFGRSLLTPADAGAARTLLGAEPSGSAATAISSHVAAPDPHTQYRLESANVPWGEIASPPTTLVGYGITDAQGLDSTLTALAGTAFGANGQLLTSTGTDFAWSGTGLTWAGNVLTIAGSAPGTPSAGQVLIGGGEIKAAGGIACATLTTSSSVTLGASSTLGAGSGWRWWAVDGGASAASDGAAFRILNGGANKAQFGNRSAVLGGAYDGTSLLWSAGGIDFIANGSGTTQMALSSAGVLTVNGQISSNVTGATAWVNCLADDNQQAQLTFYNRSVTKGYALYRPSSSGDLRFYSQEAGGDVLTVTGPGVFSMVGTTPGTPSAGQVLIGGGEIKAHGNISSTDGNLSAGGGTIALGGKSTFNVYGGTTAAVGGVANSGWEVLEFWTNTGGGTATKRGSFDNAGTLILIGALQVGNAAVAATPTPTHTVTIKDSTGTTYRIPCVV